MRATKPANRPVLTVAATVLAGTLSAGCGTSGTIPNEAAKSDIATAAAILPALCASHRDARIEDAVTKLIDEAKKAGDQRFTLSDRFEDITMADILRNRADMLHRERCAPHQEQRLRDAAS